MRSELEGGVQYRISISSSLSNTEYWKEEVVISKTNRDARHASLMNAIAHGDFDQMKKGVEEDYVLYVHY